MISCRRSSVSKSGRFISDRSQVQLLPPTQIKIVCGRSSIWLERIPVTDEVAGSSPVARADEKHLFYIGVFLWTKWTWNWYNKNMKKVILFVVSLIVLILIIFVFYSKKYSFSLSFGNEYITYKCIGKEKFYFMSGSTSATCYGILVNQKNQKNNNSRAENVKKDTKCELDDKWVKIISPTEGSVFKEREKVYVKWQYCNISKEGIDMKANLKLFKFDQIPVKDSFYRIEYEKAIGDFDLGKGALEGYFTIPSVSNTVTKTDRSSDTREEVPLGNIGDYTVRLDIIPFPEVQTGFSTSGPIFAWDKVFIKINR